MTTNIHVWFLCFFPFVLSKEADVRLTGSNFSAEGRVEIFHMNEWGSVCDDYWGMEESDVVCHQLNFSLGAQFWYSNAHFGEGTGKIFLDDVTCVGNETALSKCKHKGWQGHNCHHYEDVGVTCLTEGSHYSSPGTCDFEKGHGLCGYQRVSENSDFTWTFGSRHIDSRWPKTDHTTVNTTGEGFYLTTFMKFSWERFTQGRVARLQSPSVSSASCIEFYYFMGGSTVGELIIYVKSTDKENVVWQLFGDQGYEWKKGAITVDSKYKEFNIIFESIAGTRFVGIDIAIDDISVTNSTSCKFSPKEANPIRSSSVNRAIRLLSPPGFPSGPSGPSAGRVEVYHDPGTGGRWGTICSGYSGSFDIHAATVVCKELGFEGAEMVVPCCNVFGKGKGRIWLNNVKCLGNEPSITMCPHSGWGNTYCSHDQDVSVVCKTKNTDRSEFAVRLGGLTGESYKGLVEVKIGSIWGTITDHGWDIYDANVVCKQLHFGGAVGAYTGSFYEKGQGPVWMSDFQCKGNEASLAQCNHSNTEVQNPWDHFMDASVECFGLRLVNGGSNMSGRVEVMYQGHWGTVCDNNWDLNAGNVVCRQLGFRRAEAVGSFGEGSGQIFLDQVRCKGDEPALSFCRHSGWTAHTCSHDNDAGVVCTNALCGKSKPCLNGGACNNASGLCDCKPSVIGDYCQLPAENNTVEVVLDEKIEQWNATSFTISLVRKLNSYCSDMKCSAALSIGQNTSLFFQDEDVKITHPAKTSDKGVVVGFVVLYTNGVNTTMMSKSFVHDFFRNGNDRIADYKVIMVDGEIEDVPGGHHSLGQHENKSKSRNIYIGVGVALGLVAVLVLVFVVRRYGKRRGPNLGVDQSYVALHAEDCDDAMDNTALLRPPQQADDEGDLMS